MGWEIGMSDDKQERFFLEHGMWHDRETGQHMYTEDEYYEKYRDGLAQGREHGLFAAYTAMVELLEKNRA
jgi:hypothetical protein